MTTLNTNSQLHEELKKVSDRFDRPSMTEEAREIIEETKKKHRSGKKMVSNLKDLSVQGWRSTGYASQNVLQRLADSCVDNVERIDYDKVDEEEFIERFEKTNRPVIISNFSSQWASSKKWSYKVSDLYMLRSEMLIWQRLYKKFKDRKFKLGESDKGKTLRVKFKYFLEYMVHQKDDSPLYLFESSFDDRRRAPELLDYYEVPKYFKDDLFSLVGEKNRPPYRWWLMGPRGSGTSIHIDPIMTSAWNASVKGHKL